MALSGALDPWGGAAATMSISIHIEKDSGIAIATCSGALRLADAQQGAEALWRTADWAGRSAVWDLRAARFEVSSSDAREIARFILLHQPSPPPSRIAFVTLRDVDFGLSRMFGVFREDPATAFRVFRDYDDALRWVRGARPGFS